ncbi:MAG: ABC transporter permease [Planctomycetaceae bacterium]|nr:MAG: ABC transporter permease [Planctomycetaceae bacterium]
MFQETGEYLRQLAMLSRKEFLQFFRDPVLVLFLIYAFTLSIIAASTVVSTQLRNASTVTMDHDRTRTSRELLHGFREPYFRMQGQIHADREAIRQLDGRDAMVVLDIPEGFQDALRRRRTVDVQMLVDASNSHVAFMSSSYGERIVRRFLDEQDRQRRTPNVPKVELRQRFWFNPNLRDEPFRALEQIARMSLLFSMLLPASAMARERERGTIQQLLVSPLTPVQIMLSKVLPMTCIVLAATTVALLVVVRGVLGVALHGNVFAYLALSAVFAVNASGIGLLIATFSRNLAQVGFLSLLVMPPMNLFAGTITPLESMPTLLKPLMLLSPMYHYLNVSFGLLLEGAPLATLWDSVLALVVIGAGLFALGAWRFRREFR